MPCALPPLARRAFLVAGTSAGFAQTSCGSGAQKPAVVAELLFGRNIGGRLR